MQPYIYEQRKLIHEQMGGGNPDKHAAFYDLALRELDLEPWKYLVEAVA